MNRYLADESLSIDGSDLLLLCCFTCWCLQSHIHTLFFGLAYSFCLISPVKYFCFSSTWFNPCPHLLLSPHQNKGMTTCEQQVTNSQQKLHRLGLSNIKCFTLCIQTHLKGLCFFFSATSSGREYTCIYVFQLFLVLSLENRLLFSPFGCCSPLSSYLHIALHSLQRSVSRAAPLLWWDGVDHYITKAKVQYGCGESTHPLRHAERALERPETVFCSCKVQHWGTGRFRFDKWNKFETKVHLGGSRI